MNDRRDSYGDRPGRALTELAGLARVAVTTSLRAATVAAVTARHTGGQLVGRTLRGEAPTAVIRDVANELRVSALAAIGWSAAAAGGERVRPGGTTNPGTDRERDSLRARGAALLWASSDVTAPDSESHPAYARILSDITPDEARILQLLDSHGPQPAIDVRTYRPLGIGSELVAGGLTMIGEHAGLLRVDRVHPYLTNLNRHGLVAFSKEQVDNPNRYQLVEAQPTVTDVLAHAGHAPRIVYRSIRLTTFGRDFCRACLPDRERSDGP